MTPKQRQALIDAAQQADLEAAVRFDAEWLTLKRLGHVHQAGSMDYRRVASAFLRRRPSDVRGFILSLAKRPAR
jgi:hypothetical protein